MTARNRKKNAADSPIGAIGIDIGETKALFDDGFGAVEEIKLKTEPEQDKFAVSVSGFVHLWRQAKKGRLDSPGDRQLPAATLWSIGYARQGCWTVSGVIIGNRIALFQM